VKYLQSRTKRIYGTRSFTTPHWLPTRQQADGDVRILGDAWAFFDNGNCHKSFWTISEKNRPLYGSATSQDRLD